MSAYEKQYARILYGEGSTEQQIADVLNVSQATINTMRHAEGGWHGQRLPKYKDLDILRLVKDTLMKLILDIGVDADGSLNRQDLYESVSPIRQLVNSIKDLQELIEEVMGRDMALALESHIKWIVEHKKEEDSPLNAAQAHYDAVIKTF